MDAPSTPTNNPFDDAFQVFNETRLQQRLKEKFAPKAYYQRFKTLQILALLASYGFNIFSALTASAAVYFFVLKITGYKVAAIVTTLLFIALIEVSKRAVASRFFQKALQFKKYGPGIILFLVSLVFMSVIFSYNGAKQSVVQFTAVPVLVDSDLITATYKNQINDLDKQIEEARATKYKGTTTRTSQQTIKALTEQKAILQNQVINLAQRADTDNRTTVEQHRENTNIDASYFALFTLILEGLFLICAWYLEYYDFRSYVEFNPPLKMGVPTTKKVDQKAINATLQNGTISVNAANNKNGSHHIKEIEPKITSEVIEHAIKNVNGKIANAKYRISKNIGRKETSQRNLEQAQNELIELKSLLKSNELTEKE